MECISFIFIRRSCFSTLYLEHNPIAKEFEYRIEITRMLPSLTQLDISLIIILLIKLNYLCNIL